MIVPEKLRGLSPYEIAAVSHGADRISPSQAALLRAVWGEPLRTKAEIAAWHRITGTRIAKPRAGGYQELWLEAGRRGGKTLVVAAPIVVALALSRFEHFLAPGEYARVIAIGPKHVHVGQLIDGVEGILGRLGIKAATRDGEIEIGRALIQVTTADALGGRSGTALGVVLDELALFPTDEGSDGYDVEVLAAARPAMATIPHARLIAISTPWRRAGVHYETVRALHGKTSGSVLVARAPTWVLNPTVTEERTHELERDARRWRREYLGEPGEGEESFLSSDDVAACVDKDVRVRAPVESTRYAIGLDVGLRRDRTVAIVTHREQRRRRGLPPADLVVVDAVMALTPKSDQRIDFDHAMERVANLAHQYNGAHVHRDSWSGDAVDAALRMRGVRSVECGMAPVQQHQRFDYLAGKVRSGNLRLVSNDLLVRELVELRVKLHAGGRVEIAAPKRRHKHDDAADALALAVEAARSLPASGDIHREIRVFHEPGGLHVQSRWFEDREVGGSVVRVPASPPHGTADRRLIDEETKELGFGLYLEDDEPPAGRPQVWDEKRRAWVDAPLLTIPVRSNG